MKRALDVGGLLDAGIDVMEKRRKVKHETYNKWLVQYDREYQTKTWLDCETEMDAGSKVVNKLKCRICTKHSDRITGRRNFSDKWIVGADCVKTTNIRDHSKSDQHIHAMNLERRDQAQAQGLGAAVYAPIVQSLQTLPDEERDKLKKKFDIAYFVATEHLAFTKYEKICDLEVRHGVELGDSYRNRNACKDFIHSISESMKQNLATTVSSAGFFSILIA